ncbi:unnamed protein product [Camellia sinensis]
MAEIIGWSQEDPIQPPKNVGSSVKGRKWRLWRSDKGGHVAASDLSSFGVDDVFSAVVATVVRGTTKEFMVVKQEWAAIRIQTMFRDSLPVRLGWSGAQGQHPLAGPMAALWLGSSCPISLWGSKGKRPLAGLRGSAPENKNTKRIQSCLSARTGNEAARAENSAGGLNHTAKKAGAGSKTGFEGIESSSEGTSDFLRQASQEASC